MVPQLAVTRLHILVPVGVTHRLQIRAVAAVVLARLVQAVQGTMGMQQHLKAVVLVVHRYRAVALVVQVAILARMGMPELHQAVAVGVVALMLTDVSVVLAKYVSRTQQVTLLFWRRYRQQRLPIPLVRPFPLVECCQQL
jgi:hypothetical protein